MQPRLRRLRKYSRPWQPWLGARPAPTERTYVEARDGLKLCVRRVTQTPGGKPVVLLHGLGSNHGGFHFETRSIAVWLSERGYDCFLPELRGHGDSQRPRKGWDLDDYLEYDIPAILDHVREQTGRQSVGWIGHSMGGVLLFCYGILQPDAPIERGIAVGSALDYRVGHTGFRTLLKLRPIAEKLPWVPYGAFMHCLSPLFGRKVELLDGFNMQRSNIEPHVIRKVHANTFHTIPTSLLASLSTTFEETGLRAERRDLNYLEHTQGYKIPTLLIAGTADRQVSVDAVEHTGRLLDAETHILGRAHGHEDDYGHFDLLVGRRAEAEVWPLLDSWLQR